MTDIVQSTYTICSTRSLRIVQNLRSKYLLYGYWLGRDFPDLLGDIVESRENWCACRFYAVVFIKGSLERAVGLSTVIRSVISNISDWVSSGM